MTSPLAQLAAHLITYIPRHTFRSRRGNAESETTTARSCGSWCATAQLEDGSYVAVPILCRSWDCKHCAPLLKRRLLRRLRYAKPNLFATLTTSPRTAATPAEAFLVANAAISCLLKRWRRKFPGQRLEYFLVWELTKKGWHHAHLLLVAPAVSKHWLHDQWFELTGSFEADIQPCGSTSHAATYLTKYLAKDPAVPSGFRRWRRSAGFFSTAGEPQSTKLPLLSKWELQPRPVKAQAYLWLEKGLGIEISIQGLVHARDDPDLIHDNRTHNLSQRLRYSLHIDGYYAIT